MTSLSSQLLGWRRPKRTYRNARKVRSSAPLLTSSNCAEELNSLGCRTHGVRMGAPRCLRRELHSGGGQWDAFRAQVLCVDVRATPTFTNIHYARVDVSLFLRLADLGHSPMCLTGNVRGAGGLSTREVAPDTACVLEQPSSTTSVGYFNECGT